MEKVLSQLPKVPVCRVCLRDEQPSASFDVLICGEQAFWKNPYTNESAMSKQEKISAFFRLLALHRTRANSGYNTALFRLYKLMVKWGELRLFCVCTPNEICHADVLIFQLADIAKERGDTWPSLT